MEQQNSGIWIFAAVCCIGPIIWGALWWAIGRYFNVNPRAVRDVIRKRDL